MFIVVHVVAGIALSKHLHNPFYAFVLCWCFHFLLDVIPHGDGGLDKKSFFKFAAIDTALCCFPAFVIFNKIEFLFPNVVAWGVLGSILPDILFGLSKIIKSRFLDFFANINESAHQIIRTKISLKNGLMVQALFFLLFFLALF